MVYCDEDKKCRKVGKGDFEINGKPLLFIIFYQVHHKKAKL